MATSPRWDASQSTSVTASKTSCCHEIPTEQPTSPTTMTTWTTSTAISFPSLMDKQWNHGVAAAVDVTLLGRYYERFADHAVEIGRRVVFQVTGESTV